MIKLKSLIKLDEVRIINPKNFWDEPPLRDSETIRVYHGVHSMDDATIFSIRGMSGREIAGRRYSYEAVNNPRGLFVTVDFKVAKEFTHTVIMEFDTKVSNLEAPVWVGGRGYFGQGEYTSGFSDRGLGQEPSSEREVQRRKNRERASQSDRSNIANSDRPELAEYLFGSENQALFVGDLNPNMIKAFWVSDKGINAGQYGPWKRLSRLEFIKQYAKPYIEKNKEIRARHEKERGHTVWSDFFSRLNSGKLFQPNDDYDQEKAAAALEKEYGKYGNENWIDIFTDMVKKAQAGDATAINSIDSLLWPKQMQQLGIKV